MERSDSWLLPVAVLNERRRRAVVLRQSGMSMEQVCALCEVSPNTVRSAVRAYEKGGWDAVAVQAHRGPDKGERCLLDEMQQQEIERLIYQSTPDELDLRFRCGVVRQWRR